MTTVETGESVAVVVVTFNRADLLTGMLDGLAALEHRPDAVIVVDNHSGDHTPQVLADEQARDRLPLQVIRTEENLGGAGGFHLGLRTAYEQGWDRAWLMDDDVVPAPDCLTVLMAQDEDCLTSVREDSQGRLCEKAATRFDLTHPWAIKPKTGMVEDFGTRAAMPCSTSAAATMDASWLPTCWCCPSRWTWASTCPRFSLLS